MREKFSLSLCALATFGVVLACLSTQYSAAQDPQDSRQLARVPSQTAATERRIALVIGNGAYANAPVLKNPPNDARDMTVTLKTLGFDVTSGINVNQKDMKRLIREFGQKLKAGGSGLFYYAGHGVQSKGHNYLIPVDAEIQSEAEVEDSGVDVNLVLNFMDDAQNGLNIVILDACRDNPFARSFRSATNGLAQVDAPTGTLIAYATAPGRVASDGTGQNGLYTSELLKQMRVPGLSATEMFMRVRAEVMRLTGNKQVPWEASSLVGTFYFREPSKNLSVSTTTDRTNETRIEPVAVEREYWETIRSSNDPQDYKDYLQAYPSGAYAVVARAKIRQIETAKNTQRVDSQPTTTHRPNSEGDKAGGPASGANPSADTGSGTRHWQKLSPRDEEFSVLMPKETKRESRRNSYVPLDQLAVTRIFGQRPKYMYGWIANRNVYRSQIGNRPFFAVISHSGINAKFNAKSQPSEAEKLDSFVDAFRHWLSAADFFKGPTAQLTLVGEKSLNGNSGREYRVAIGDLSGIARAYLTRKRFYVAVMLDATNQDVRSTLFLDSFVLSRETP